MAIKRIVDTSFWTDGKVDEFSPEDKYFMLYLLTNPFSTQLGIYEISIKQVAFQLGYSMDAVKVLLERFENKYNIILYSQETREIAVKNYLRHSIIKGGFGVWDCIIKEIRAVKDKALVGKVFSHIKGVENLNPTIRNLITDYEKGYVRSYKEWSDAKQNENENQNDNENDNDNENENENDNETTVPVTGIVTQNPPKTTPNQSNSQLTVENLVEKYVENFDNEIDNEIKPFRGSVMLSENQISELLNIMGLDAFDDYVDRLNAFIKTRNANIKDHYSMILKWYNEDKE